VLALAGWMLLLLTLGPLATFHQTPVKPIMVTMAYFCSSQFHPQHVRPRPRAGRDSLRRRTIASFAAAGFVCAGASSSGLRSASS